MLEDNQKPNAEDLQATGKCDDSNVTLRSLDEDELSFLQESHFRMVGPPGPPGPVRFTDEELDPNNEFPVVQLD